ncbi:MAG: ABC transporter ATP-binding protein [Desulfarculus sp.]|nr:ABC transporter ATP-binding protein [Desulfarculus sp.]
MKIEIHHTCEDFNSYRAARVKSLFNCEAGYRFDLAAELPVEDPAWGVGLIVGPSGSGKTSLGREIFGAGAFWEPEDWPHDQPIIDAIAATSDFNAVTAALAGVGLGDVPAWLRPYTVLSNGEKFRANLARVICEAPARVVIDEFTSVVDRQIAKVGAFAFAKAWKRLHKKGGNQCVLLSCHYDIIEWTEPDWVFDVATGKFTGRGLWRRPRIELEIWQTDWRYWPLFEPHHYLRLPRPPASCCYVGTVDGEPVVHLAMTSKATGRGKAEARNCRFVVMPEWQGAGVGLAFMNAVCQMQLEGKGRLQGRKVTTLATTSHPGLAAAFRRDPKWRQISCNLYGANKVRSRDSIARTSTSDQVVGATGFGGHFRAVQGFRYYG